VFLRIFKTRLLKTQKSCIMAGVLQTKIQKDKRYKKNEDETDSNPDSIYGIRPVFAGFRNYSGSK